MPFQNDIQNRCLEFQLFLQHIKVKKIIIINGVNAYVGAYFMKILSDSDLLGLGSTFNHCLSPSTCALIKQYVKHFHA